MHAVAPVPPKILDFAGAEAASVLRCLPVRLKWLNCSAQLHDGVCEGADQPTDISIRVLPKALAPASGNALGMAIWSEAGGTAVLFYDRALSVRNPKQFLAEILGRAMAHEVVHLILGTTDHFDVGLMRSEWTVRDLGFAGAASLELTPAASALVRAAIEKRIAGVEVEGGRAQAATDQVVQQGYSPTTKGIAREGKKKKEAELPAREPVAQ